MNIDDLKQLNVPENPGSYQFYNDREQIIYVGKAINLRSRVSSYWRKGANLTAAKKKMLEEIVEVKWVLTDTEIEALLLEANLIKKYQPYYNVDKKDDKRFSYIKITTDDEIPGIFIVRNISGGGKYFGPFTSVGAVRETLKVIRKIWPYCTEKKVKKKICFYAQIGRCTGVCGGEFDIKDYKEKIIKPIIMFLEGKKAQVIKNQELIIKNYEKELKKKSINEIDKEALLLDLVFAKKQLLNINYVLASARIISLSEKYVADVLELAKVLQLPKVPERIEGYDISNIFGEYAVGSMVVFNDGEPNKKFYRKFKIKAGQGSAGDVVMLKEILERRMRHIDEKKWPNPDLIIIDGGKGQLNAGLKIIKKYKMDIPVISISKGLGLRSAQAPDKIFFPGENKAVELPLASPALHIIKRVRDEAHRFAIKYHRELRKKGWIKK